jgi:Homing endonuclease associated repeat
MQKRWSDQEILDALRLWTDKHGRPPKWKDWMPASDEHPSSVTVWNRCGSWHDALVMAGVVDEPPQWLFKRKFSREAARALRSEGLSDAVIGNRLGVHGSTIGKALGPRPRPPRKPRNAAERREARIAALKKALAKTEGG